jgi:hypothetical protein
MQDLNKQAQRDILKHHQPPKTEREREFHPVAQGGDGGRGEIRPISGKIR